MIEDEYFGIRTTTIGEIGGHVDRARSMLVAASAASLLILGAGSFFLALF